MLLAKKIAVDGLRVYAYGKVGWQAALSKASFPKKSKLPKMNTQTIKTHDRSPSTTNFFYLGAIDGGAIRMNARP